MKKLYEPNFCHFYTLRAILTKYNRSLKNKNYFIISATSLIDVKQTWPGARVKFKVCSEYAEGLRLDEPDFEKKLKVGLRAIFTGSGLCRFDSQSSSSKKLLQLQHRKTVFIKFWFSLFTHDSKLPEQLK